MVGRRSRAAAFLHGDAEPLRLVDKVVPDSRARGSMTPIGSSSSMASLRLNGAGLAYLVQSLDWVKVKTRKHHAFTRVIEALA